MVVEVWTVRDTVPGIASQQVDTEYRLRIVLPLVIQCRTRYAAPESILVKILIKISVFSPFLKSDLPTPVFDFDDRERRLGLGEIESDKLYPNR